MMRQSDVTFLFKLIKMHSFLIQFTFFLCVTWCTLAQGQDSSTCGIRHHSFSSLSHLNERIVGGKKARAGSWPWTATVLYKEIPMKFCGASLIHPQWVLSAAHCFKYPGFNDTDWRIELGKYSSDREESYTQYRDVEKVSAHMLII